MCPSLQPPGITYAIQSQCFKVLRDSSTHKHQAIGCATMPAMLKMLVFVIVLQILANSAFVTGSCFPAVFSFGDSKADTGNLRLQNSFAFPYGETFPGFPFNRFSDGRLVIDWMQLAYNLPLLEPSLNSTGNFTSGINFALDAATARGALPLQYFQYVEFRALANTSPSPLTARLPPIRAFNEGLHVISIGENDYRGELLLGMSFDQINASVPSVVAAILNITEKLYSTGARNFFIVGIARDGCTPLVATRFKNNSSVQFDQFGCVVPYDDIMQRHNSALLAGVVNLRTMHPDATFIFGDYFGANTYILQNATQLGVTNRVAACCGGGDPTYNYNSLIMCGVTPGFTLCPDPRTYYNWDGIHFTDKFYGLTARLFLSNRFIDSGGASLTPGCTANFTGFYPTNFTEPISA